VLRGWLLAVAVAVVLAPLVVATAAYGLVEMVAAPVGIAVRLAG
jgi:hypothetical protein